MHYALGAPQQFVTQYESLGQDEPPVRLVIQGPFQEAVGRVVPGHAGQGSHKPRQAVEILEDLKQLTGNAVYVFPSARSPKGDRAMSDNAVLAAMRGMGISKEEMSGHGFRAMARTMLEEVLGFRPDLIEHQLAHQVRDPNGRAYNRTAHLPERKKMMQQWANYLDGLCSDTNVMNIRERTRKKK